MTGEHNKTNKPFEPMRAGLPWLLLLLGFSVSAYKAATLSFGIFDSFRSKEVLLLFVADWRMLAAIFLFAALSAFYRKPYLVIPTRLAGVLFTLWYIIDTFLLLIIGHKFSLERLAKFQPETSLLASFISPVHIALILLLLISPFIVVSVRRSLAAGLAAGSIICLAISFFSARNLPQSLVFYQASVSDILQELPTVVASSEPYSKKDIPHYQSLAPKLGEVHLPEDGVNIIVVVVEALSAVDSLRTSGLRNNLRSFDSLSRDGIIFKNFIANHSFSSGGLVSIFQGVQPIPFPGAYPNVYRSFTGFQSVPNELHRRGYHTEMLQGSSIRLLFYGDWAKSVGFDVVSAGENTSAFENVPRFALDAPSDQVIFAEAIRRIHLLEDSDKPYLFGIQTASTHPPFRHPETGSTKEDDLIRYTDRELGSFYEQLRATSFFDNGLLIVTGDHRKQSPITQAEWGRYGDSAPARIPLTIIGKGIPREVIDERMFQQSQLFSKLVDVPTQLVQLSADALFTIWTGSRYQDTAEGNLVFFDSKTGLQRGYRASVYGREFRWISHPSPNRRKTEYLIHAARAMLQVGFSGK